MRKEKNVYVTVGGGEKREGNFFPNSKRRNQIVQNYNLIISFLTSLISTVITVTHVSNISTVLGYCSVVSRKMSRIASKRTFTLHILTAT